MDLYQAVSVPVLAIMDALRGMDGQNGPSGGRVLKIGKILASSNPVALDVVMAAMAGAEPASMPTTRIAAGRGLGPCRIEEIDVQGEFEPIAGFRLPSARLASGITGLAAAIAYPLIQRRPLLDRRLCIKCRRCSDNCPAKAITLRPFPVIDKNTCIHCYCCAELCPEKALSVPGPVRGLVQKITGR